MTQCIAIHSGRHYFATAFQGGLIVQNRNTGKGTHLLAPAATQWIEAIKTAIDPTEAEALCRAVYNETKGA